MTSPIPSASAIAVSSKPTQVCPTLRQSSNSLSSMLPRSFWANPSRKTARRFLTIGQDYAITAALAPSPPSRNALREETMTQVGV
jgi:hypothetical protein